MTPAGLESLERDVPKPLPRLAEGTELAGEFVGAGYREPPLLVYRADGQAVRLPELLYRTVRALDDCRLPDRDQVLDAVAATVTEETGRELAASHVEFLLDNKLAPLGVTTYSDGSAPELAKPQPVLSLTCKMTVLSERATWFLAGLFTWLFRPPALACAVAGILAAESWVFGTQDIATAMERTFRSPGGILLVVLMAVGSTAFHEVGHSTACRYGGVRPGVSGCGFYLAWPVFYTDITNSYRLGRGGRLRADLGGVYFNGVFILALTGFYLVTRSPLLLAAILSTSVEAAQQLLPTLRFDGYYIVADLVGVPDLFKYIGPILRRVLFGRPDDGRLAALRRWPQVAVTVWVLCVIPALFGQLGLLAYNFPAIVMSDWASVQSLAAHSMDGGSPVIGVASATVQILLLLFPLAAITLIGLRLLRGLARFALRWLSAMLRWLRAVPRWLSAAWEGNGVRAARRGKTVLPLVGAVMALALAAIMVWALALSVHEGAAADLRLGATGTRGFGHPVSPSATWPGVESRPAGHRSGGRPRTPGLTSAPGGSADGRPAAAVAPVLPGRHHRGRPSGGSSQGSSPGSSPSAGLALSGAGSPSPASPARSYLAASGGSAPGGPSSGDSAPPSAPSSQPSSPSSRAPSSQPSSHASSPSSRASWSQASSGQPSASSGQPSSQLDQSGQPAALPFPVPGPLSGSASPRPSAQPAPEPSASPPGTQPSPARQQPAPSFPSVPTASPSCATTLSLLSLAVGVLCPS